MESKICESEKHKYKRPKDCSLQDCLALGAIFATTDSVAVLQVLEEDRAPLLFSLVFGEGVINDATSVALLRTVQVLPACVMSSDAIQESRTTNSVLSIPY